MDFSKITLAAAVFSMLSGVATPAFAGHNPLGHAHGHGHGAGIGGAPAKSGGHHFGSGNSHSNKGGELRGLDRANEAAGSHGQQGRDKAAANQPGSNSSDSGDSDSE
jgi:hypothetical protein